MIWIQHSAGSGAPVFNPDNSSFDFIGDERPVAGEKVIIKQAPSRCVHVRRGWEEWELMLTEMNQLHRDRLIGDSPSEKDNSGGAHWLHEPCKTPHFVSSFTTQQKLTSRKIQVCVSSTARVAFESGLDVVVVRDAVGDRDIPGAEGVLKAAKLVETVLDELADAFATVVDSRQVMA